MAALCPVCFLGLSHCTCPKPMTPQPPAPDAELIRRVANLLPSRLANEVRDRLAAVTADAERLRQSWMDKCDEVDREAERVESAKRDLAALTAELARVKQIEFPAKIDKVTATFRDRAESAERKLAQAMRVVEAARELYGEHMHTLATGYEKIVNLGGECDPLDRMIADSVALESVRAALADMDKGQG
jgi:chromosome segregation ATPase